MNFNSCFIHMTGLDSNPITTFSIIIYIRSKLVQYVVNEGCAHHELSKNTCFSNQTLLNLWHEHFLYGLHDEPMFILFIWCECNTTGSRNYVRVQTSHEIVENTVETSNCTHERITVYQDSSSLRTPTVKTFCLVINEVLNLHTSTISF